MKRQLSQIFDSKTANDGDGVKIQRSIAGTSTQPDYFDITLAQGQSWSCL